MASCIESVEQRKDYDKVLNVYRCMQKQAVTIWQVMWRPGVTLKHGQPDVATAARPW